MSKAGDPYECKTRFLKQVLDVPSLRKISDLCCKPFAVGRPDLRKLPPLSGNANQGIELVAPSALEAHGVRVSTIPIGKPSRLEMDIRLKSKIGVTRVPFLNDRAKF